MTGRTLSLHERRLRSVGVVFGLVSSFLVLSSVMRTRRRAKPGLSSVAPQAGHQGQQIDVAGANATAIARPRDDVFSFVRDVRNWPRVITALHDVEPLGGDRWRLRFGNGTLTADVNVRTEPDLGKVSWTSGDTARMQTKGSIQVQDAQPGRGTVVAFDAVWRPAGGTIGQPFVRLFSEKRSYRDLVRLKALLEGGKPGIARHRHPQP